MSIGINGSAALEQAKLRYETAQKAKANAEQAKADAAAKEAEAAAVALKEAQEAENAEQKSQQENADIAVAQEKVNTANLALTSANAAYTNALSQLSQAQASGNESAIATAQAAVDRAYAELQKAQNEADEANRVLEKEIAEANEAAQIAEKERAEAMQAEQEANEAKEVLSSAENELQVATNELTEAEAALAEAEVAAADEADGAAAAEETTGVQQAEHLSQEEIDKLVNDEGYTYISSLEQFLEIFQNGNIDLNGNYILGCDIDLSSIENWNPVGNENDPFKGVFNGNGYSVENLTINAGAEAQNVGFFGVTENAVIENVSFINANVITPNDFINGSSSVGVVAGLARGTKFENIDIAGTVTGYESVGGLVGSIDDNSYEKDGSLVEIGNSYVSNVSTAVDVDGKYFVGGLIGYVADTSTAEGVATRDLKITNCNTSGNIVFDEESAGGFIGEAGKTIITINNCESSVNITWNNDENDGDLSFLMETGRAGGFIGCVNGSYIAICNSDYNGNLNVDGDFKGNYYGWYMNDAQVTLYEIPSGLPIDDILNIDGIDALTPITDPATGVARYEVTVSTLTGLDKMVSMIQANPALADIVTFNVNFDFEAMDGMYDESVYSQYGIVQRLYEDEDGVVHNDVYIDNEIDLETEFHADCSNYSGNMAPVEHYSLSPTMVKGLYKNENGEYVVTTDQGLKAVDLRFNYDNQVTTITKRLEADQVRYREYITQMVHYYQQKMHDSIKAMFGLNQDDELPIINKAEYKKLLKLQESGVTLTDEQKLAMAVFELDSTVMNIVAETTHNNGCGMGGNASFLDETKAIQMYDDSGRPLFTTLKGDALRQRMDEEGNLMFDDDGEPVYEYEDGSDYDGFDEIFAQRGYPVTDEDGNLMYSDTEGNAVTKTINDNGEEVYLNADGSVYEGSSEDLKQQLNPYNNADEYGNLENKMKDLLNDVESGKFPRSSANSVDAEVTLSEEAVEEKIKEINEEIL